MRRIKPKTKTAVKTFLRDPTAGCTFIDHYVDKGTKAIGNAKLGRFMEAKRKLYHAEGRIGPLSAIRRKMTIMKMMR